jgi:hypothetical protein
VQLLRLNPENITAANAPHESRKLLTNTDTTPSRLLMLSSWMMSVCPWVVPCWAKYKYEAF